MTVVIRDCNLREERILEEYLSEILRKIEREEINTNLRDCLTDIIKGTDDIYVDCVPERGNCGYVRGLYYPPAHEIELCMSRVPALLFHELVHACGGNEFDAEVYENFLYNQNEGARKPGANDKEKMKKEGFMGKFAERRNSGIWNREGKRLMSYPIQ